MSEMEYWDAEIARHIFAYGEPLRSKRELENGDPFFNAADLYAGLRLDSVRAIHASDATSIELYYEGGDRFLNHIVAVVVHFPGRKVVVVEVMS